MLCQAQTNLDPVFLSSLTLQFCVLQHTSSFLNCSNTGNALWQHLCLGFQANSAFCIKCSSSLPSSHNLLLPVLCTVFVISYQVYIISYLSLLRISIINFFLTSMLKSLVGGVSCCIIAGSPLLSLHVYLYVLLAMLQVNC